MIVFNLTDGCVMRLFDLNVAFGSDDFLSHGGLLCARNQTAGSADAGVVICIQPTRGQYVTVLNLEHLSSEPFIVEYEKCFSICEIKIFVEGNL